MLRLGDWREVVDNGSRGGLNGSLKPSARLGENASSLHFVDTVAKRLDHGLDIRLGMRGGEITRESFLDMNTLFAEVIIDQASESLFGRETEIEDRAEILEPVMAN